MKLISSRDNPLYKELKQLATSSQARRKAGHTLLDGVHLCEAWLQHCGIPHVCVVSEGDRWHPEVAPLLARCEAGQGQCVVLPDALYHTLRQVEHGTGMLFVVETPKKITPAAITRSAVLLDNVQDPGNLGSILRSAAAAGILDIFCSPGTAFAWSPKVLRAGMGAHFLLNVYENVDLAVLIGATTLPVLATSSHAQSQLYDLDLREPVTWVFGHEGQGVAPDLLALATQKIAVPHLGAMESLNVAACAAVCFFEQLRQKML